VLLPGEPRNAAVNFDTHRLLQRHRMVTLPLHDFLVYISDHSNAEITHNMPNFTAAAQSRKSRMWCVLENAVQSKLIGNTWLSAQWVPSSLACRYSPIKNYVVDPLPVTGRRALVIPSRQPGAMLQGIPSR